MIALILGFVLIIVVEIISAKPYYSPAIYFASLFLRDRLLPNIQVRNKVAIQLVIILLLIIGQYVHNLKEKDLGIRRLSRIKIPALQKEGIIVIFVIITSSCIGLLNGYALFHVLVDIYKVLDIFIFYYFFSYTWRTQEQVQKCLNVLEIEMCIFGLIEMFVTERGGIGINIAISFAPFFLIRGFSKRKKHYWFIGIMSILIVLISETRTYMIGFAIELVILGLLGSGYRKNKIIKGSFLASVFVIFVVGLYMTLSENTFLTSLLDRILALRGGIEGAGGYRIYEIQKALEKFAESPILGKGYGYMEYVYIKLMGWFEWGDFMHNSYVEVLLKTGIVGAMVYGACLIDYIAKMINSIKYYQKDSQEQAFLIAGLAGTAGWLLIYNAAPLSSYGYIFIPGIIGMLYSYLPKSVNT